MKTGRGSRKRPNKRQIAVLDILIAHDNAIVRMGLHTLLKHCRGLRVCGETGTASETVKQVKKLQPDLLILKLGLPDNGSLEIIPDLLKLRPCLKILLLTEEGPTMDAQLTVLTPAVAQRSLTEGALALVLKPDEQDILLAIDALSKNKSFVSSNIFEGRMNERKPPSRGDLTGCEAEVLQRMAAGKTTKEIATDLQNSPRTIEAHRANIMRKLGFHSQADLILFALQHGVVALPASPLESRSHVVKSVT